MNTDRFERVLDSDLLFAYQNVPVALPRVTRHNADNLKDVFKILVMLDETGLVENTSHIIFFKKFIEIIVSNVLPEGDIELIEIDPKVTLMNTWGALGYTLNSLVSVFDECSFYTQYANKRSVTLIDPKAKLTLTIKYKGKL